MSAEKGGEGFFAALKNLLATSLAIGKTRLQLLVNEVEEEKFRLLGLLLRGILALFLFGLGLILLVVFVAVAFWEQRLMVFGLFTFLFLGAAFWLLGQIKAIAAKPSALLRDSLAELDADIERLRRGEAER